MTPVVIMRTAVCIAVRRTSRIQSTRERRSRMSSAASSLSRPTSASARLAPSSAARVRIASNSASGMRTKPRSDRGGVIGSSSRCSADLAAPEGRAIGGEVAVGDPEIPLKLDGIARGQRRRMEAGEFDTVTDLAKSVGLAERRVSRQLRLALPRAQCPQTLGLAARRAHPDPVETDRCRGPAMGRAAGAGVRLRLIESSPETLSRSARHEHRAADATRTPSARVRISTNGTGAIPIGAPRPRPVRCG